MQPLHLALKCSSDNQANPLDHYYPERASPRKEGEYEAGEPHPARAGAGERGRQRSRHHPQQRGGPGPADRRACRDTGGRGTRRHGRQDRVRRDRRSARAG